MVDFNINLTKSMTSTPEGRARFYNGMMIYLVACAAAMVYVAYASSLNIMKSLQANKERNALVKAISSVSEYGQAFYGDPGKAYGEFSDYAADLDTLKAALAQRAQFLPVLSQLFLDFPDQIALQSLSGSAADKTIEFVLVAPVIDEKGEDLLRMLQSKWNDNDKLRSRAHQVTQVASERNMVGDVLMANVRYKCILK